MSSRARILLSTILLLGLVIRVAYILEAQANPLHLVPQMDAGYHLEWARAFLAGEDHHPGPFFRAPLYPWFLAAGLWLTQGHLLPVLLLQALLGVVTTWLTFGLARSAFPRSGPSGPLIAASLVAVNWVLVYFDGELLLPALGIPLQLLALKLTLELRPSPGTRAGFIAGAAWGLAALVRPNCLLFVALIVLWKLLRSPRMTSVALALAAGTLAPILPVTAYNASQGDSVLISSQAGINLWIGNNPSSDGSTAVVPDTRPDWWGGHLDAIRQAEDAEGRPLRPSEVSRHYARRALSWAVDHPGEWLAHSAHKLKLLVSHRELGNNADVHFTAHNFSRTMRALPPSFAPLLALGLVGLLFGLKRREVAPELPVFLIVYALSIALFFVCARYRAPLLPILACGAGHVIAWSYAALRAGRLRVPLLLALLSGSLITLSALPSSRASMSDAPGRWQLGVAALQAGDPRAAIGHLEEVLESQPGYWYAWRDLGRAHMELGDLSRAEDALRRGLLLRPHEPWIADLLADVLFQSGRSDDLLDLAGQLLLAHPSHATAHYHRARAHLLRGDERQARESVEEGLTLDPTNFQCLFLGARFSGAAGDDRAACVRIQSALKAAQLSHNADFARMALEESARLGCP